MFMQIENITKTFGDNETLAKVSFTLPEGAKVGLVGANGSGKSTLLKIITGEVEPDSGRVLLSAETTIGYLPQVLAMSGERRIDELMNEAMGDLNAIESRMRTLEVHMASDAFDASRDDRLLMEYGRLQERYDRKGGYDGAYRVDQVMAGLGLEGVPRHKSMNQLSGGEQSRVGLASLLLTSPDLLLLDEPTNHLDFEAIAWLEQFLSSFSGAMLVVSHDRRFLNNVVHTIVEIDEHSHQAKVYSGSYDYYAAKKNEERVRWQEDYERQQDEIRELRRAIQTKSRQVAHNRPSSDSDKFLKAFKAGRLDGAISRNVRNAEEKLRRIEKDPIPRPPRSLRISPELNPSELVSRSPMTVSNLYKRYGSLNVLQDVSFSVDADARIAIVGPNGAGKSTLLQVLVGRLAPDSGEINVAGSTRIGYLDQQQETLTPSDTVYQAYCGDRVGEYEEIKAELLGYGLFTYPDLSKRVGELSVGQQRKLQIALLCASRANLLLLDEPTNHVSLDVLEQFEAALAQFEGPILAVSHDRQFLSRFANEVWTMDQGKLRRYIGSWDDYVDRTVDKVFSS